MRHVVISKKKILGQIAMVAVCCACSTTASFGDELTLGVINDNSVNDDFAGKTFASQTFLTDPSLLGKIIRKSVTENLTVVRPSVAPHSNLTRSNLTPSNVPSSSAQPTDVHGAATAHVDDLRSFELVLADAVEFRTDSTPSLSKPDLQGQHLSAQWLFRIRRDVTFHNGRRIAAEDVRSSIARCADQDRSYAVSDVSIEWRGGHDEAWVVVHTPAGESAAAVPAKLSRCAIVPKRATAILGREFGRGNTLIGSGPYELGEWQEDSYVTLRRFEPHRQRLGANERFRIQRVRVGEQGLAALRVGNIIALFGADKKTIELASKDETLVLLNCGEAQIVSRRNVILPCVDGVIDLWNVGFRT